MAILIENRQKKIKLDLPRVQRALISVLTLLNVEDCEISVLFVDDGEIASINSVYLNRDYPTNVISFPMREGEFVDINPHILGDVVISVETAFRDAQKESLPFEDELDYLMIHGILHLLGYDHETCEAEAKRMKEKEGELFFALTQYSIE